MSSQAPSTAGKRSQPAQRESEAAPRGPHPRPAKISQSPQGERGGTSRARGSKITSGCCVLDLGRPWITSSLTSVLFKERSGEPESEDTFTHVSGSLSCETGSSASGSGAEGLNSSSLRLCPPLYSGFEHIRFSCVLRGQHMR